MGFLIPKTASSEVECLSRRHHGASPLYRLATQDTFTALSRIPFHARLTGSSSKPNVQPRSPPWEFDTLFFQAIQNQGLFHACFPFSMRNTSDCCVF